MKQQSTCASGVIQSRSKMNSTFVTGIKRNGLHVHIAPALSLSQVFAQILSLIVTAHTFLYCMAIKDFAY